MSAKWSVLITSPLGDVLAQIKNFIAFDFVRTENDIGAATLTLPGELSEGFFATAACNNGINVCIMRPLVKQFTHAPQHIKRQRIKRLWAI
jgi:hypothetical protein